MNKILEKPILFASFLLVLAAYLFFFRLGDMALTDPDETFYAQTAKEMLYRGEWLTPYLYGKPQFEKPIFFYWLVEASFKIFGVNEFAARFPSALFALLGLVAIYLLGELLFNRMVGMLSALIIGSSVEYVLLARACVTDMVLATLMLFGVLFFFYGHLKEKLYFYLLSAASFALATLTKGPIAIILAGTIIGAYLLLTRRTKALQGILLLWMILVFLAVALPWYLLMYRIHGKNFLDVFFGFHNITRFLESEHKIGSQPYYNVPIVFGGFFPWSVFLVFGFWRAFKKSFSRDGKERNHVIFLLLWFFVIFLFFSVSSTKLATYIFPSFLSLALLAALFWDDFLKSNADARTIKEMKISYYLLLAVAVSGAVGALVFIRIDYPVILSGIAFANLFLIFGLSLSLVAFRNKKPLWTFFLIIYSLVLFAYPVTRLVLPEIERYETSKSISRKLSSLMKAGEALASESNYLAGLAFYTGRVPVDVDKHHNLVNFMSSEKRVWCVLKEKNHKELYTTETKPYYTKPSYMVYRLGKRAIITNKIPEDGVYMIKRQRAK